MEISNQKKGAIKSIMAVYNILEAKEMENLLWDLCICAFSSKYINDWDGEHRAFTAFNFRVLMDFFKGFYLLENEIKSLNN